MATLHIVNKASTSEAFLRCLSLAAGGDAVLLIEDGVYCGLPNALARFTIDHVRLVALRVDCEARGVANKLSAQVTLVEERDFVDLVVRHQPVVTWS
jgi:tRNA 2-thiouridine synthesizing protein B